MIEALIAVRAMVYRCAVALLLDLRTSLSDVDLRVYTSRLEGIGMAVFGECWASVFPMLAQMLVELVLSGMTWGLRVVIAVRTSTGS